MPKTQGHKCLSVSGALSEERARVTRGPDLCRARDLIKSFADNKSSCHFEGLTVLTCYVPNVKCKSVFQKKKRLNKHEAAACNFCVIIRSTIQIIVPTKMRILIP